MNFIGSNLGLIAVVVIGLFGIYFLSMYYRRTRTGQPTQPANNIADEEEDEGLNTPTTTDRFRLITILWPLATILIFCFIMAIYTPNAWNAWVGSAAFIITIISVIVGIVLRLVTKMKPYWYYILVLIIPIIVTRLEFRKNPIKSEASNDGQKTEVQAPDTTYHNINGTLAMILVHGETYETTLQPNCEVTVRGTNFKQIITTDSLGIKNLNTVEGDASQVGAGQFVFIHTKGNGTPIVKTWRVF